MISPTMLKAIEQALEKGFAVELFLKPNGKLSVKTVSRKEIKY